MKPFYISLIGDKMLAENGSETFSKQVEHAKRHNSTEDARGWAKTVIDKSGFPKEALMALVKVKRVTIQVEDCNG